MSDIVYPRWQSSAPLPEKQVSEFIDYQINPVLYELTKGKRIAFVGPSPHINGKEYGDIIDSYDLVVRAGNLKPVSKNLCIDYGFRTDILVHSFNVYESKEALSNTDFIKTLKYVLCSMVSTDFIRSHEELFNVFRTHLNVPTENVDDRYLFKLFKEVGTTCNVGFSGLMVLLQYKEIKEVFVTGMNFYNMGQYGRVYNNDYYEMVTKNIKLYDFHHQYRTTPADARADLHDQQSQILYFKKILKQDNRITLDEYLAGNMQ